MKKKIKQCGNTWEQLSLPIVREELYSAVSADSLPVSMRRSHDPTWDLTNRKIPDTLAAIDSLERQ